MKNSIKLFGMLLVSCAAAALSSCKDEEKEGVTLPVDPQVTNVGPNGALLSWTGSADTFQIDINGMTPFTSSNSYVVTGLSSLTNYTWRVRAVKNSEASEWVTGPAFTTVETTVSVDFGDGEEVWTAGYSDWYEYESEYGVVDLFFTKGADKTIPAVQGAVWSSDDTVFSDTPLSGLYFEYYSEGYWDDDRYTYEKKENGEEFYYGDWWVKSGTVTITSLDGWLVSGSADLVMYDYYDYSANNNPTPAEKKLKVTFANVPRYAASRNAAIRSAIGSPDRRYSFKMPE